MTSSRIPKSVAQAFDHPGPFVTVYLDASRNTEKGAHEVELRWRGVREALQKAGATDADLQALDDRATDDQGLPGAHGLVLVAAGGEVVFDATLPAPPVQGEQGLVAPLPHLMPYLAQATPRIGYVLCATDLTGADITAVPADVTASGRRPSSSHVTGEQQHPLRKTGRDVWDERHFQNRVENAWKTNAKDVADAVKRQVESVGAELLVIAGDPRARSLVRQDAAALLSPGFEIVEIEHEVGGGNDESFDQALRDCLLKRCWHERHEVLEHLRENVGRGRFAVTGTQAVVDAVRRSQVDTVVLSDDPSSTLTAWIGPEPLQVGTDRGDLEAMGVTEPMQVRFDAALLRALAGSGAQLLITPNAHRYVPGGLGALLRYDDASTAA